MSKYNTRGSTESAKNVDGKGEAHSDSGTDSGRENEKLNESTKAKSLKKLNGRAQPLSGDNRCNSRASGSLYSNSHRNDESENSDFDEFSVRRNVQKKKSSHRHGSYTSRSSNYPSIDVRRSGRQRKSMTENSDDGLYADGSSFRYEGDNRRRSSRSAARSATLSRKYQDRSSPSASDVSDHTLREQHSYRSIRDEEVVDDVNGTEDMYSHIKNRRRSIPRKGNGKMMKAKITEESLTDVETVVDDGEPANDKDYSKVKKDELSIMVDNEETENDEKTGNVDRHETEESSESSSESESDDNKGMKLRDRKERAQQRGPDFGGPSARGKYQLRQRRTLARPVQHVVHRAPQGRSRPRAHPFSRQGYVRKHNSLNAPSSSSSSDETHYEKKKAKHMAEARSQCLPMNFKAKDLIHGALRDRQKVGSSLADIQPMAIDRTILFDKIGGLETHVKSLKEMVLFPLLYPEIFEKYKIQPPRGVLFHGPPGTGKTLVARALANECSSDGKKVAFFMRKGADCLSKWVGESERQLRLLFDQAYSMRPAIIFFDEIDGIAPVRSSKQDQIHSSIVSTLLALMDGLDCRGEVIIVGATNRIDAIDPALRRPGRFDREFFFPLPSFESRKEILSIHTKDWQPAIDEEVISTLAAKTVGYCGADLKALCAETALISLRRRYPQIYNSKNKLLLNVDEVIVGLRDFNAAIKKIVPATQRSSPSVARPLSSIIKPLLNDLLNTAVMTVKKIFPEAETRVTTDLLDSDDDLEQHLIPPIFHSAEKSSGNMIRWAGNYRPRFLIYGNKDRGHSSHLAPALLHSLEHLAHLKLDASALYSVTARTPEESLAAIFSEALKRLPAVLYIPHIDSFWEILSDTLKVSFVSLLDDLEPSTPLLVLATSEGTVEDLPTELQGVFSRHCCTLKTLFMSLPSRAERETFFEQLFKSYAFKDAEVQKPVELCNEVLPEVVVKDNRKLSDAELKRLKKKEEQALRQLRLFLGEIIIKIMRDRRFQDFLQPVDQADAPDYTDVIKHPMDLELMMAKLDDGQYECAQEFLSDIHLITDNALEYNPCNNTENKKLRHCAVALRDFANALIEAEMDSDFETYCQEMVHSRRDRGEKRPEPVLSVLPPLIVSLNKIEEGDETEVEGESVKVIGDGLSVKGLAIKRKKDDVVENGKRIRRGSKSDDSEANSSKEKVDSTVNDIEKVNGDDVIMIEETQQSIIASSEDVVKIGEKTVQIDEGKLKLVFKRLIDLTEGIAAEKLEQLYWSLFRIMRKHVKRWERLQLPNDLSKELDRFETSLKTIA